MTSKIDSLGSAAIGLGSAIKGATDKPLSTAVSSAAAAAPVDKVSLTGDAVRMQQLDRAASVAPDVDTKKVASIKSAIASGNYRIDSQAVASKLARMDWELGTA